MTGVVWPFVKWLVILLVLALLIGFIVLKSGGLNSWVKDQAENALAKAIPNGQISFEEIDISSLGETKLRGIELRDQDGKLSRIENIEVDYNTLDLLSKKVVINSAKIQGGQVHLQQTDEGSWNLLDLVSSDSSSGEPSDWTVNLSDLRIENLGLIIDPQAIDNKRHQYAGDLNAQLRSFQYSKDSLSVDVKISSLLASQTATDIQIELDAKYSPAGLNFTKSSLRSERSHAEIEGQILLAKDTWIEESDFSINLNPLSIEDIAPFSSSINGSANYTGSIQMNGIEGSNRVQGNLQSDLGDKLVVDAVAKLGIENSVSYDFSVDQFDLKGITGDPSQESDIAISSKGILKGENLNSLSGKMPVNIKRFIWPELPAIEGQLTTELRGGEFMLAGQQSFFLSKYPNSKVFGDLSYSFSENARLISDGISIENLNIRDLLPESEYYSSINAQVTSNLKVPDFESISGELGIDILASTLNEETISEGILRFNLEDQKINGSGNTLTSFGEFFIESMEGQPLNEDIAIDAVLRFRSFRPQSIIEMEEQDTDLSGKLILNQLKITDARYSADADLHLQDSHYGELRIDDGKLLGSLRPDGSLIFQSELESNQQYLSLNGEGNLLNDGVSLDRLDGRTRGLDISKVVPDSEISTDLNSTFSGNLIIINSLPSGEIELDLDPSRINSESVSAGKATLIMDKGDVQVESNVTLGDGDFFLASTGSLSKKPYSGEILGRWTDFDLAKVLGIDTLSSQLNGAVNLTYSGSNLKDFDAEGIIVMGRSVLQDIRLDTLISDFSMKDGSIAVDTLLIRSNVVRANGQGNIYLEDHGQNRRSDFSLSATLNSMQPLAEFVGVNKLSGEGKILLDISGQEGSPRFEFEPELRYLAIDEAHLSEFSAVVTGLIQQDELSFDGLIDFGVASVPAFTTRSAGLVISYSDQQALLTGDLIVDKDREGSFAGILNTGETPWVMSLEALDLNLYEDRWSLDQIATIEVGDGFEIRDLLMESGDQQIVVDGSIDLKGQQNLVCTVEGIKTGAFTDLLGYRGLDGTLDGWVLVEGNATDPIVEGLLTAQDISSFGRPVGGMEFESSISDGVMNIDAVITNELGNTLTVDGFLPLLFTLAGEERDVSLDPVGLVIKADTFDLNLIEPFLNKFPVEKLDGFMTADISIGGIDSQLDLQGELYIDEASIGLRDFGVIYDGIKGRLDFDKTSAILDGVELKSGKKGRAAVDGTVDFTSLTEPVYDLGIRATDFKAIWDNTYQLFTDASLKLTGSQQAPVLEGDVTISPGDIFLTDELIAEELEPINLTDRDLQILEERFGYRVSEEDTTSYIFYEALTIKNLDLSFDNNVWIRSTSSPEMDIEFGGRLDVTKSPNSDPLLVGTVEVNPSRSKIVQFGKRFNITKGEITMTGSIEEALINLEAEYVVPSRRGGEEVSINLTLSGRQDDLKTSLSSDPLHSTVDIISYIATGRPADESVEGASGAATDLAVGQLSSLVEGFAGDQLGLDVFEIVFNTTDGAEVTLGKYLSRELYVSFSQALSEDERESSIAMEYELFKWLQMQLERRDNALRFNLLWEYAF